MYPSQRRYVSQCIHPKGGTHPKEGIQRRHASQKGYASLHASQKGYASLHASQKGAIHLRSARLCRVIDLHPRLFLLQLAAPTPAVAGDLDLAAGDRDLAAGDRRRVESLRSAWRAAGGDEARCRRGLLMQCRGGLLEDGRGRCGSGEPMRRGGLAGRGGLGEGLAKWRWGGGRPGSGRLLTGGGEQR